MGNRLEKLRKSLIYFYGGSGYWQPPVSNKNISVKGFQYIINMSPRLSDGHFIPEWFDARGVPRRPYKGSLVYNITRVCGYGLANHDEYLKTGQEECLEKFMTVANWLSENGHCNEVGFFVPYRYGDHSRPAGYNSAMSHGQVLSVFSRAAEFDPSSVWRDLSASALLHYGKRIEDGGIVAEFPEVGYDWFEEDCSGKSHILNGYIYAIEGLWDLNRVFKNREALILYEESLDALESALKLFDVGYWSKYDCHPEQPRYVASYSYHLMHCVLLMGLASRHPERKVIFSFAEKWQRNVDSFPCRMKAAAVMLKQKVANIR